MRHLLLTILATAALCAASMAPAAAADPRVELSRDGVTWAGAIRGPLFDPAVRWVPGDTRTETFYVRNRGGSAADLSIDVIGSEAGELLDSGDLHVTARGGGGDWTRVSEPGVHRLLTATDLADGAKAAVHVTVAFDAASVNPTRREAATFAFRVTLSQATGSDSGSGTGDGDGDGGASDLGGMLPGTGAAELRWVVALAAVLLGSGAALVAGGRRRSHDV